MKGNPRVVAHLQRLLNAELGVADLSLLHARIYEDRGFPRLSAHADAVVGDAREALDRVLRRMLFLGAKPDMNQREPIAVASAIRDMLRNDLNGQYRLAECLRGALGCCHDEKDFQTAALLQSLLATVEERHAYWLEQQLGLLETVGEAAYLAAQMG
jgi:bacterioferritin